MCVVCHPSHRAHVDCDCGGELCGGSVVMDARQYILRAVTALVAGTEKACLNKVRYGGFPVAREAAKAINGQPNNKLYKVDVYPCPWCRGYHVGRIIDDNGMKKVARRYLKEQAE